MEFGKKIFKAVYTPAGGCLLGIWVTIGLINPLHNAIYGTHSITVHDCKPPYTYGVAVINNHQTCFSKE